MIEANRQLKGYEKIGGETRVKAPVKVRRPRLVGLAAAPGFGHGVAHVVGTFLSTIDRNLRARDIRVEHKRLEEALVALALRTRRGAASDGAADAGVRAQDFRRPQNDSAGRRVRRPHPRHRRHRLRGGERAVPGDRRAERATAGGGRRLPARARHRLSRRRPSPAAPHAPGRTAATSSASPPSWSPRS